ncbi:zinc-dependent metalloprotease [Streptomyces sp. NPDC000877]|uniref:zinc-dependent metalloprotease n=1 Tax=unclassified Streptomyces TaxID=2593676 RepID=UPI00331A9D6E
MRVVVRQEAGPAFAALGARLEQIGTETAPLVSAVTGLPLPDTVIIRTMAVDDWKQEHRRSSKQHLVAEALQLGATFRTKALLMRRARLLARHMFWPTMLGEAVALEPGHPELVIVPEALRHAGRLEDIPVLHKLLGHEMTHLAQYAASDGAVWAAQDSYFPAQRGIADRDYPFLVEGHAYWADRQITTKLFGQPVSTDEASAHASDRYLKLHASPMRAKAVEQQRRATDSVARLIDTQGLDTFNRVWTDPTLVPTKAETGTPDLWQRRFG